MTPFLYENTVHYLFPEGLFLHLKTDEFLNILIGSLSFTYNVNNAFCKKQLNVLKDDYFQPSFWPFVKLPVLRGVSFKACQESVTVMIGYCHYIEKKYQRLLATACECFENTIRIKC